MCESIRTFGTTTRTGTLLHRPRAPPCLSIPARGGKETGRARGFAFATMNTPEGAKAAIAALNGKDWKGRSLTVNEARPREERGPSSSRGYGSQSRSRY